MSDAPETTALVAAPAPRQAIVVDHVHPLLDTGRFEQMQRAAKALMCTTLFNDTVRGKSPEECFSNLLVIFDYADRWKVPAVMLAQCASIVHGKLMWEGKAIAAAMQATLGVELHYHWVGERGGDEYRVYVWDQDFATMSEEVLASLAPGKYPRGTRMIDGSVAEWRTFQKDNRSPNPAWTGRATQNQLAYRGAREWARLYASATMLGVYGDDEFSAVEERMANVTPAAPAARITTGFTRAAPDGPGPAATVAEAHGPDEAADAVAAPAKPAEEAKPAETAAARKAREKAEAREEATRQRHVAEEAAFAAGRIVGLDGGVAEVPAEHLDYAQCWKNGHIEGSTERTQKVTARGEVLDAIAEAEPEIVNQVLADHADAEEQEPDEEAEEEELGAIFDAWEKKGMAGEAAPTADALTQAEFDAAVQGWHSGASQKASTAEDDDAGLEEPELEAGHDLPSAFATFNAVIRTLADWPAIRVAYNELARTDDWKAELSVPGAPQVRAARVATWCRVLEVVKTDASKGVDQAEDVTAYRCFLEYSEDADEILAAWQGVSQTDAFKGANPSAQQKLQEVSMKRMQELRGS